jgi:hypothetical protein
LFANVFVSPFRPIQNEFNRVGTSVGVAVFFVMLNLFPIAANMIVFFFWC